MVGTPETIETGSFFRGGKGDWDRFGGHKVAVDGYRTRRGGGQGGSSGGAVTRAGGRSYEHLQSQLVWLLSCSMGFFLCGIPMTLLTLLIAAGCLFLLRKERHALFLWAPLTLFWVAFAGWSVRALSRTPHGGHGAGDWGNMGEAIVSLFAIFGVTGAIVCVVAIPRTRDAWEWKLATAAIGVALFLGWVVWYSATLAGIDFNAFGLWM